MIFHRLRLLYSIIVTVASYYCDIIKSKISILGVQKTDLCDGGSCVKRTFWTDYYMHLLGNARVSRAATLKRMWDVCMQHMYIGLIWRNYACIPQYLVRVLNELRAYVQGGYNTLYPNSDFSKPGRDFFFSTEI